ncbi:MULTISPECIES: amidohydrolase family protein [unclassified Streptomyces]|uniref:amidohydrolase family protein n=1 Tax=unclassified Streptomyces TaxID=2593676 RepID=UPI003FD54454
MSSTGDERQPGPLLDCNVHLWDQADNPVFWLSDRSMLRDVLGNYDALPDRYTLADYERDTAGRDVRGIIWSDAGATDPVGAAAWVARQQGERGLVKGMVTLGDPASPGFAELVRRCREVPLITSVRVRLATALADPSARGAPRSADAGHLTRTHLALLAESGLVATVEATGDQLGDVAALVEQHPGLRFVVDHFGWPTDLSDAGRREHIGRLARIAQHPNAATRIDALGTIFGNWTPGQLSSWLLDVTETFGPDRCMLGSDLPLEHLRSGFDAVYDAYDTIFAGLTHAERRMLFHNTAEHWYTPILWSR